MCRRCNQSQESVSHVISNCRYHSNRWRARHNAVQNHLVQSLQQCWPDADITTHKTVCTSSRLRPDICVTRGTHKILIDIKVPMDLAHAFVKVDEANREKYKPLVHTLNASGFTSQVFTFITGALGAWWPSNNLILNYFGCSHTRSKQLAQKCRRSAIHWSRNIWVAHTTGVDQNY